MAFSASSMPAASSGAFGSGSSFGGDSVPSFGASTSSFGGKAPAFGGGFGSTPVVGSKAPAFGSNVGGFGSTAVDGSASASRTFGRSAHAFTSSRGVGVVDNASDPFGRVEDTLQCFARNGTVSASARWSPPKMPSRPLFQSTTSTPSQSLFGPSTPQPTRSLFGSSGSSAPTFGTGRTTVSGGGFTFGASPTNTFTPSANSNPSFGAASVGLGRDASSSKSASLFGSTSSSTAFASSTAKPPLAPSSNPFAVSISNGAFTKTPASSFTPKPTNPFTISTAKPLSELKSYSFGDTAAKQSKNYGGNPFASKYGLGSNVNPFAANVAPSSTVNPFAAKVSPSATVNPFSVRRSPGAGKNPFAAPASACWKPTGSASAKFKTGLRSSTGSKASPWGTHRQQTHSTNIDWTGWKEMGKLAQPNAKNSSSLPAVSSSEENISPPSSDSSSSHPSTTSNTLVASPDVNPYGSGSFGLGLVELKVKTAIANPPELNILNALQPVAVTSTQLHQQPSPRFAARLGLARQPLQRLSVRPVQPRFPSCTVPAKALSAQPKFPQADPFRFRSAFSRLAISKRNVRVRVQPSETLVSTTANSVSEFVSKENAGDEAEAPTEVVSAVKSARSPVLHVSAEEQYGKETPSPLCPVLLNDEYFTEPSVNNLQLLNEEELARVENFVVGRHGCGKISFVGAVDVRGLQLDELVAFSKGEVIVYPNDQAKPEAGCGLNKPAIVCLHGIFAGGNESYKDFLGRLESHTQALGATFIGYDEELQAWSFRVEHF
ncbi:unnamed protein product [Phytophthora lilii]|uniref:Unnamed protein product n=1 Tax=Phytophthora lilii TaxID=2077276 RepID=A0A9W6TXY7_9STRA|nr:unnamed protein product [Phytophthora lilii]